MKITSNIDALKICYVKNDELFTHIIDDGRVYFDGFFVEVVHINEYEDEIDLIANVQFEGTDRSFALLQMNNRNKYCFIRLQNRAFYDVLTTTRGLNEKIEKKSVALCLPMMADEMGLAFNNVTSLDVCVDLDVAAIHRVRKAIKDIDNLDLFINGRKVKDDEGLPIMTIYGCTRKNLLKYPSLYFAQKDKDIQLKIYHKGKELLEQSSAKENYTRDWDGINGQQLQRLEIRLKKDKIREFCRLHGITEAAFLEAVVTDGTFRMQLFNEQAMRLVYFKTKKMTRQRKGEKIDLLSVVFGLY